MILVDQITVEAETDVIGPDGKYLPLVPKFKQDYAKKTKEMWRIFEFGNKHSNKDLAKTVDELSIILNKFRYELSEYSKENGDLDDWV